MVTPLSEPHGHKAAVPLRYTTTWTTTDTPTAAARHAVRALLDEAGHPPDGRPGQDAQLVVSELVTNAVRHAPGPGRLILDVTPDRTLLRITVSDSSPGHRPEPRPHDPRRLGGHGLYLVQQLCGRLNVTTTSTGKHVTARLRLGRPHD
ncbi:ATP-binding protein [Streptomyces sp. NPDC015171]|uniref:ATP-binding protein n=1 Tax=Streptomyces sp. NPDC015171 TaxID=3364945 RepID=UPI003701F36C